MKLTVCCWERYFLRTIRSWRLKKRSEGPVRPKGARGCDFTDSAGHNHACYGWIYLLSIVKKDPVFSSIPVIVTTQSDSESDEVAALSHGASDFAAKPYKPQIILHRVASIINLRENAAMVNQLNMTG